MITRNADDGQRKSVPLWAFVSFVVRKASSSKLHQHPVPPTSANYTGILTNFRFGYFLYTTPPFITNDTLFTTPMSSSGSPGTATMSA